MRKPLFSSSTFAALACVVTSMGCVPGTTPEGDPPPFPGMDRFAGTGGSTGVPVPVAPRPGPGGDFTGPTVSAPRPPPAVSGGTLLVLADGKTAFAADPDRDALYFADLVSERLLARLTLAPGDEPGRAVESRDGEILVVLRRGGAVVAVDGRNQSIRARAPVCAAPRGIDYDPTLDLAHVACTSGELVTISARTLEVTRRVLLENDLRDVVVAGDRVFVSRFRTAEILVIAADDGRLIERRRAPGSAASNQMVDPRGVRNPFPAPPSNDPASPPAFVRAADPVVAWRMRRSPAGGAVMIHQESSNTELGIEMGGYGGGPCKSPMGAAVSEFGVAAGAAKTSGQMLLAVLPVDFALSRDGRKMAVAAAGNEPGTGRGQSVLYMTTDQTTQGDCVFPPPPSEPIEFRQPVGRPIAISFDGQDRVVVQTREPARIEIISHRGGTIKLSDESRLDTGHVIFHLATSNGLACASCHPEGGEDGRTWRFAKLGDRRTQSLLGGILSTAPFHWDGDMRDLGHLMNEVFTGRMGGPKLEAGPVDALARWLDRLPALPPAPVLNPTAVERGKTLFNDVKVGCAVCHNGPTLTTNATVSVGTGRAMQVPSLRGLRARAPYMHNGCAQTLLDRFDPKCGGGDFHGVTSHLTPTDLTDLAAFLETL